MTSAMAELAFEASLALVTVLPFREIEKARLIDCFTEGGDMILLLK